MYTRIAWLKCGKELKGMEGKECARRLSLMHEKSAQREMKCVIIDDKCWAPFLEHASAPSCLELCFFSLAC